MTTHYWRSHDAFLDHKFPNPPKLIRPILPWGGIALVYGPPGHGKTLFALTLARAVAEGHHWLHEFECKPANVLMLETDMPNGLYQEYWSKVPQRDLKVSHLSTDATPFDIVFKVPEYVAEAAQDKPGLVIVDSLRNVHGLDEDASTSVPAVYGAFRRAFPGAALVFLHHDRKDSTDMMHRKNPAQSARGSSAWSASADLCMHLERTSPEGADWKATLSFTKVRGAGRKPFTLKMDETSLDVGPSELTPRQRALKAIKNGCKSVDQVAGVLINDGSLSSQMAYELARELLDPKVSTKEDDA